MSVLKVKLGAKVLEITSDKTGVEMIQELAFWSALPEICSECKSDKLSMFSRSLKAPKKGTYVGLKCQKCGAEYTFHQNDNEAKTLYVTDNDTFKIYQKEND